MKKIQNNPHFFIKQSSKHEFKKCLKTAPTILIIFHKNRSYGFSMFKKLYTYCKSF